MSTLQFPANPVVGDTYDWDAYKYVWDGEKWKTVGIGYNPVNDLRDELEPRISNEAAYQRRRCDRIEARLAALESK